MNYRTVLLLHETSGQRHYDWLLEDPRQTGDPEARLWTARVAQPSSQWRALGRLEFEPLPPHRRLYLTYEGPIAGERGTVRRVDEGTFTPQLWSDERIELHLFFESCRAAITMTRGDDGRWLGVVSVLP